MTEISSVLGSIWAWRKHSKCKVVSSEPSIQNMILNDSEKWKTRLCSVAAEHKSGRFLASPGVALHCVPSPGLPNSDSRYRDGRQSTLCAYSSQA